MKQVAAPPVPPHQPITPGTVRPPLRVGVLSRNALTRAGLMQMLSRGGVRRQAPH